jgi:hypothetical protein
MAYAENTSVPIEKSMSEIVALVRKAGAERIAQAEEPERLAIQCFLHDRLLRFAVRLPRLDDMPKRDGGHRWLTDTQLAVKRDQARRQRARALLLVIKAKLESVESGVETFEEAFLANVVMPDGKTVGELALPAIESAYRDGKQPQMLLGAQQ